MADDRVADEELLVRVDFSLGGNSAEFRGQGWSGQEKNHIWTVGATSELLFKQIPERGDLHAKVRIAPFIATPAPTVQRLTILANGLEVGYFTLTGGGNIEFTIPEAAIRGQQRLLLELSHPDAARPSDAIPPQGDGRLLAVRLFDLELRRAAVAAETPAAAVTDGAAPIVPVEHAEPAAAAEPVAAETPAEQIAEPVADGPVAAEPEPEAVVAEPVAVETPAEVVAPAEPLAEPEPAAATPQPDSIPASKTTARTDFSNGLLATLFPWIKWR